MQLDTHEAVQTRVLFQWSWRKQLNYCDSFGSVSNGCLLAKPGLPAV